MKQTLSVFIILFLTAGLVSAENPKREFRGAWMHTVFQEQYRKQTTEQNKAYLCDQLDRLSEAGVNAVIFQVRPQADAFYHSSLEPWSRFLTDNGLAPNPDWDPLQFMIEQAHARGMELHAWLNPYRVTSANTQVLPKNHIYNEHPEWFVRYDGKLYFDPALPQSRQFITDVVMDIVNRYDVDGIHFDDYFYPYPVKGHDFPDSKSYAEYGGGADLGDWRRKNVDLLIEGIHESIAQAKPWVIFGVSPFGIWRNKSNDPRGSDTNGLQNYDALYADVLLWAERGWVDYLMPQLYWEIGHKVAPYEVLVEWWNNNSNGRYMFIGQSISNTMTHGDIDGTNEQTQLRRKIEMARNGQNIDGNCWWPAYDITKNLNGVADSLMIDYQATVALMPTYPWISATKPEAVKGIEVKEDVITWEAPRVDGTADDVVKYAVYRFEPDETIDLENVEALEAVVWKPVYKAEYPGIYVVTALSRVNQESGPSVPIKIN